MADSTFLPDDYLAQRAERRTNFISLTLFVVVMIGVIGAFLVTNRQWTQVKAQQDEINARVHEAGMQLEELSELQDQETEMIHKGELVAALVERVPRSILLAELINRMPPRLGLLEFTIESEKVRRTIAPVATDGRLSGPKRSRTREEVADQLQKVEVPRYIVGINMVGVAPTDLEVSKYIAELNGYELVDSVTLEYSEEKEMGGRILREFSLNMVLDMKADVRDVEPLVKPRDLKNPMIDDMILGGPGKGSAASVTERNQ